MGIIYKILKKDKEKREDIIAVTSGLGIVINVVIALIKVAAGLLASSIAIVTEGVNNAADALTSVLTLVGTKLAGKHPDQKHPFGYGRIEYLTSLVVSGLILFTGIEMLISSAKLIFNPTELAISYVSLAILAVSAVIKFCLALYTIKMGRKSGSGALEAVGLECRGDSIASVVTIISAVVFLVSGYNIDAFAGIFTSLLIIKAGAEVLLATISELIGRPGDEELARQLYKEILNTDGIINAADMMLHNYGPDSWSGSVNVEIDHEKTVGELYAFLHALQLRIMHEYHVTMVFGVYAVDNDHEEAKKLRGEIASFVRDNEYVKSYHAVYVEPETEKIYCDLIVEYKLRDWEKLRENFMSYMSGLYPGREVELTIETEFV